MDERKLRLRLAARTLIEWKTPVASPNFKAVLNDIIQSHPYARSYGLSNDSKLFTLAHNRTLLWYLTETLDVAATDDHSKGSEDTSRYPTDLMEAWKIVYKEHCCPQLIDAGILDRKHTVPGTGGLTKAQVAAEIAEIVTSAEGALINFGFLALLGLSVPLSTPLQAESFRGLHELNYARGFAVRFFSSIDSFGSVSKTVGTILAVFSTLLSVLVLIGSRNWARDWFFYINLVFLAVLLIVGVADFIRKGAFEKFIKWFVMLFWRTAADFEERLRSDRSAELFARAMDDIFRTDGEVFGELLRAKGRVPWGTLALATTHQASSRAVESAMECLAEPQIAKPLRDEIFKWLCGVTIRD